MVIFKDHVNVFNSTYLVHIYFFYYKCLTVTVRDDQMAYICGSSIYASLHVSGVYNTIHIRQHLDGMEETTGKMYKCMN